MKKPIYLSVFNTLCFLLLHSVSVFAQDISGEWTGSSTHNTHYIYNFQQNGNKVIGKTRSDKNFLLIFNFYSICKIEGYVEDNKFYLTSNKIIETNGNTICYSTDVPYYYSCNGKYEYLDFNFINTTNIQGCQDFKIKLKRIAHKPCNDKTISKENTNDNVLSYDDVYNDVAVKPKKEKTNAPISINCNAPNTIISTPINDQTTEISWAATDNATNYTLYYKPKNTTKWSKHTTDKTGINLHDLPPNTIFDAILECNCRGNKTKTSLQYFDTGKKP